MTAALDLKLLASQIRYEQIAFWRNRRLAFFTFGFPLMFLVIFGSLNQGRQLESLGINWETFFVPGILAYGLVTQAFSNIAISMATARDNGVIKRVQGAPVPWWTWVAGRIGSTVLVTVLMCAVTLLVGTLLLGVDVRAATLPGLLLAIVLGTICFTPLGVGFVRMLPSADTAGPMQAFVVMPVAFISNIFFPLEEAPAWVGQVADALPLKPLADALHTAFDPTTAAPGIAWPNLEALGIWSLVGIWLMMRVLSGMRKRR